MSDCSLKGTNISFVSFPVVDVKDLQNKATYSE
jgi:hypothetical protein